MSKRYLMGMFTICLLGIGIVLYLFNTNSMIRTHLNSPYSAILETPSTQLASSNHLLTEGDNDTKRNTFFRYQPDLIETPTEVEVTVKKHPPDDRAPIETNAQPLRHQQELALMGSIYALIHAMEQSLDDTDAMVEVAQSLHQRMDAYRSLTANQTEIIGGN